MVAAVDDVPGDAPLDTDPRAVIAALHLARRRHRIADADLAEAFYRIYITVVVGAIAVWVLSGVVGDARLGVGQLQAVVRHGPGVLGAGVAALWAVGVVSGGRGGPLAIEEADVHHVLMAPVDRADALRRPALQHLRAKAGTGVVVGAVAGLLAFRRLPGGAAAWVASGAAVGLAAVAGGAGLAMVVSGRRTSSPIAGLVALGLVAWSGADVVAGTTTSPASLIGDVALWPLQVRIEGALGVVAAVVVVALGVALAPGVSIEAAQRRSSLVGQLRFAVAMRDVRTAVVLQRQLAQDQPRQRPWVRLPRTVGYPLGTPGRTGRDRHLPVWRRSWHGLTRFPATRLARLVLFGVVGGASAVGLWRGTTPLAVLLGATLYLTGLDALESLAQDLDKPDRMDSYAITRGALILRHLGPPVVMCLVVGAIGVAAAVAMSGGALLAVEVGLVTVIPSALAGLAGALMSLLQGAPAPFSQSQALLPPEAVGLTSIIRQVLPPGVALLGTAPLVVGRHPGTLPGPVATTANVVAPVLAVVALVGAWVYYRDRARASFSAAMEEVRSPTAPRIPG